MPEMKVDAEPNWPSRMPLLVLALLIPTLPIFLGIPFLFSVPAALCLFLVLKNVRGRRPESERAETVAIAAVLAPVAITALVLPAAFADGSWVATGLGVVALATAVGCALMPRLIPLHLVVVGCLHLVYIHHYDTIIDVGVLVRDSTAALMAGRNPYSLTFLNPYDAAQTAKFWSPELIDGDRIIIGFPYLPGALLGYLPGHLLGEVRYVSVVALLGATLLAWRLTSERIGRLLVAAMPATPIAVITSMNYWVEPLLILAVALLAWALVRGSRWGAVLAVLMLLSVKQYAVVWLPLERFVRRKVGIAALLWGVAAAAFLVGGFFLLAPGDFWFSVVKAQFLQPYRPDSMSLGVDLVEAGLPLPVAVLSIGSLLAGLGVAWWVRVKAPITATWAVLGLGLSLLATVLISKQAFVNYYVLVHGCVVMGVALWPAEISRDQNSAARDP